MVIQFIQEIQIIHNQFTKLSEFTQITTVAQGDKITQVIQAGQLHWSLKLVLAFNIYRLKSLT